MTTELKTRVETILRNEIAPALELDGTGIEVVDVSDGIAQVRFSGSCGNCPGSMVSLIMGIEQELRSRIPEIAFLEAVP
jgi:Fe-S cluster biogenesis protein NfuA